MFMPYGTIFDQPVPDADMNEKAKVVVVPSAIVDAAQFPPLIEVFNEMKKTKKDEKNGR